MKVAVIGGAGLMGRWFADYFSSNGFPTIISDPGIEDAHSTASSVGVEIAETNIRAVENVDLAIISVPIDKMAEVVHEVAPHMKKEAVLAEVSSIKEKTIEALRKASSFGVRPLSIHPMFGPSAGSLKGKTIVVVPVINGDVEASLAQRLFEEAKIVVSEKSEHDNAMAIILSLTYFMNLAFAQVFSGMDIKLLKTLAGTSFTVQLAIAESIASEEPSLVSSLLRENRFADDYFDSFIDKAKEIRELIKRDGKGFLQLLDSLRDSLERDPDYSRAAERRQEAFEALNK